MNRRKFITKSLAAGAVGSLATSTTNAANFKTVRILGVSCSPRKGKTTATAVKVSLDAAKEVDPRIKVELIDLGACKSQAGRNHYLKSGMTST